MPSLIEFGQAIKNKYPEYANMDDMELGRKMLERYPEYKDRVADENTATSTPTQGYWDAIKKGGQNIVNTIKEKGAELADTGIMNAFVPPAEGTPAYKNKDIPAWKKGARAAGIFATGAAQALVAEPVMTGLRVGGEAVEDATGYDINEETARGMNYLMKKGMDTKLAKDVMDGYQYIKETNPERGMTMDTWLDVAEVLSYFIGAKGAAKGKNALAGEASKLKTKVGGMIDDGKGKLAPIGEKIIPKAEGIAEGTFAKSYGIEPETIKQVMKSPEYFTESEMLKITDESVFNKVKQAVDSKLDDLAETGAKYDAIRKSAEVVDLPPDFLSGVAKKFGLESENGVLKATTNSITRNTSDINAIQKVISDWSGKTKLSANEFLNLRSDLADLAKFDKLTGGGKTKASETIAKAMRAELNKSGRPQLKNLFKLDDAYSKERDFMQKVKNTIFERDGRTIKSNAISTISNLTGKGKEQILSRIEKIVPGITKDVNILKAIKDIQRAKGNKVGTYGRAALGVGSGALAGGPVGAIIGMILTSPETGIAILRAFAKIKKGMSPKINSIIDKMKKGIRLTKDEIDVVNEAVDNAAKKLASRTKEKMSMGGLSIKDVSGESLKGKGTIPKIAKKTNTLIQEARKTSPNIVDAIQSGKYKNWDEIKSEIGSGKVLNGKTLTQDEIYGLQDFANKNKFKTTDELFNILKGKSQPLQEANKFSQKRITDLSKFERDKSLKGADAALQEKSLRYTVKNEDKMTTKYMDKHGRKVNPDEFRPFFKDIGYNGSNSAAVQEASSYLAKRVRAKLMQNDGKYFVAYAGGSGTGKTSALKNIKEVELMEADAAGVLDGNLSKLDSALKIIAEAKAAKKKVPIVYVYREIVDSFTNGVVERMKTNVDEMGRIVPIKVMVDNHIGSWQTVVKLKELGYEVWFVDNSLGWDKVKNASNAKLSTFKEMSKKVKYPSKAELYKNLKTEAERLLKEKVISSEQYAKYIE